MASVLLLGFLAVAHIRPFNPFSARLIQWACLQCWNAFSHASPFVGRRGTLRLANEQSIRVHNDCRIFGVLCTFNRIGSWQIGMPT